jgi:uncharacterized protein YneF (UPF0154 family)
MRISRPTLAWVIIVVILVALLIAQLLGIISIESALANFYILFVALLAVTILAIIGAVFLGIFISHRIFTGQDFTPFEKEMLSMKDDIDQIKSKLDEVTKDKEGE